MPSPRRDLLPADVLAALVASDSARPRVTFYDDADGPTRGERIELSAKVLTNWVSKAGNALQEELDAGPGREVLLAVPTHWRALYWALAVWSVGATLRLPGDAAPTDLAAAADVVVSDEVATVAAAAATSTPAVLVSLPMLARSHPGTPSGAVDEARELATYGDVFDAWEVVEPTVTGLVEGAGGDGTAYGELVVPRPEWGDSPRVLLDGVGATLLGDVLSAFAADGSVVVVRGGGPDQSARAATEGVTVDARR